MLIIRIFLAALAALYAVFAVWCTISPTYTAEAVGLHLGSGSGRSEYLTVYGGLQLGLAVVFGLAAWHEAYAAQGVLVCWLVHGCIVAVRVGTLMLVADIAWNTYALAGLEMTLFASALALWWLLT